MRCFEQCGVAGGERVPPAPLGWYRFEFFVTEKRGRNGGKENDENRFP